MSQPAVDPNSVEVMEGREREQLEGWIPSLASDVEIREALEKAFDYRGDVKLTLRDGRVVHGYVFDRRPGAAPRFFLAPRDSSPWGTRFS